MKTAFLHMAYDTLSSVAVLIGGIVIIYTGWVVIDVILSVIIALMILWSSYGVIREAVMILLEAVPPGIEFDRVYGDIMKIKKVTGVHDLHIWGLSTKEIALTAHLVMPDKRLTDKEALEINKALYNTYKINHVTLQTEQGCEEHPCLVNQHCH